VFAGRSDDEDDNKEDTQDCNDKEEACFPPSVFDWEPNPVILPHLRGEHLQSLDSGPSIANNPSDCHLVDTAGATGKICPGVTVHHDEKAVQKRS
jgi:hypothetical protein